MLKSILSLLTVCMMAGAPLYAQTAEKSGDKAANPSGQKGITVFPARLLFTVDKGASASQTVTIGNFTDKKYQLSLDFRDWVRDTLGKHVYTPLGTSKQSCASWVTFDKQLLELEPNETTNVTVTINVPNTDEAVSEMKWTMLVVKTAMEKFAPTKSGKMEALVEQIYGIGVHILQTPPNVNNKELKMLSFTELPGAHNTYRIACRNIGGVELNAKFSIELSSNETGAKTALEPKPVPLFPQQNRFVDFTLPNNLPKGKYTAIALIDAEDDNVPIEAAEKEIVVR